MKKIWCVLIMFGFSIPSIAQQKIISPKSLEGKNLEELYLMRNEIFARHGRPFKTHELDTYFRSKDWYKLDLNYDDSRLSKAEMINAEIIKKKELELLKHNYTLKNGKERLNFNNIINKWQFGTFSQQEIDKLCTNGFLVVPAKYEQFFYLYEDNDYKGIASFVTTDAILQLYHIFFDFTLRNLESEKLYPILRTMTAEMVKISEKLYKETDNAQIRKAAFRNIAYFGVPYYFLTGDSSKFGAEVFEIIKKEVEKCKKHQSRKNSLIFNPDDNPKIIHNLDYTQFIPRGHYTRSKRLKRYFMSMMWFGLNYFLADKDTDMIQSLLITQQLFQNKIGDKRLIDLWKKIYEPTAFYVGISDDLSPLDYKFIIDSIFGDNPKFVDFTKKSKLEKAKKIARKLYGKTKIRVQLVGIPPGPQFRFMGQRYIPDSEILQKLSKWPQRPFPKGLDITAVLGSKLAKKILLEDYKEGEKWNEYPDKLEKLTKKFGKLKSDAWRKNLYYSWIWCLKSLIELSEKFQYSFFMKNEAWGLKSLNTSLASWAELRHDVILYGKQSGTECGDGEEWFPDPPKGYVEPNVIFYRRLGELLSFTKEGLEKRNLLTPRMEEKFKRFIELVSFLEKISVKELTSQPITKQEYTQIKIFGALLENLTISVMVDKKYLRWFEITSDVDKNISVVADVHTSEGSVLEEGVGPAYEIYTVVEINGYLKLTRGAVFSYYEFTHPASDRLTDKKWQEMLKRNKEPSLPNWIKKYISDRPAHKVPRPKHVYGSGC